MMRLLMVGALILTAGGGISAQENQPASANQPGARQARPAKVQAKLTLVFSRFQGEKKLSSVPYVVPFTANDIPTSIRMGTRIPIVSTVFSAPAAGGAATIPQSSYSYQNVGTEIDCNATTMEDGTFLVNLTVTDSSVYYPDKSESAAAAASATTGAPAFRNFSAKFTALLHDGQTTQYVAATDPVSGQVVKIDATLNLLK
jgi:type II secretory pathway component GspD/PulD (secretin)